MSQLQSSNSSSSVSTDSRLPNRWLILVKCNLGSHCYTERKHFSKFAVHPWVACYTGCQMFGTLLVWNETFVFSDWSFVINKAIRKQLNILTKTWNKDKWTRKPQVGWGELADLLGAEILQVLIVCTAPLEFALRQNHVVCDTITTESTVTKNKLILCKFMAQFSPAYK